jgi:hypothetical protein
LFAADGPLKLLGLRHAQPGCKALNELVLLKPGADPRVSAARSHSPAARASWTRSVPATEHGVAATLTTLKTHGAGVLPTLVICRAGAERDRDRQAPAAALFVPFRSPWTTTRPTTRDSSFRTVGWLIIEELTAEKLADMLQKQTDPRL